MVERTHEGHVLSTISIELKARRTCLHVGAIAGAFLFAAAISRIPLPSVTSVGGQNVAYGYMGFPLFVAPIIASWLHSPVSRFTTIPTVRVATTTAVAVVVAGTVVTLCSASVGSLAGGGGAARVALENGLWVTALTVGLHRWIEPTVAPVLVVAYGMVGLFLVATPGFFINRQPSGVELVLVVGVLVCQLLTMLHPRTRSFVL